MSNSNYAQCYSNSIARHSQSSKQARKERKSQLPRYFDTGSGQANECLGEWLNVNCRVGIQSFRGQFGYFEISALQPYAQALADVAQRGNAVKFVLGANDGNLSAEDVRGVLNIIQATTNGGLVVVRYANALFHPKTLHLMRDDGSEAVLVGSANFTGRGLGQNVEAMIGLDTRDGDALSMIHAVRDAIDRWSDVVSDGVFSIRSEQNVLQLIADGVIDVPQVRRSTASIKLRRSTQSTLGRRVRLWTPPTGGKSSVRRTPHSGRPLPAPTGTANLIPHFTRWCKQLSKSDAQQVTQATNPTGKLRLSKAGFDIDLQTAFRNDLFGAANWQAVTRNGKTYEVAEVDFEVQVRGNALGTLTLTVDHAAHRVAGQNNVPTVLAWGLRLNQMLRGTNYVGDWVVIENNVSGYTLTIQTAKPSWSP